MHSLLYRQLRKLLPPEIANSLEMQGFLNAVNLSYKNNDDKLEMMQRSIILSSDELSNANVELLKKIDNQKKIMVSLSRVVSVMEETPDILLSDYQEVDAHKIAVNIEEQTDKILELTEEKNILLKDLENQNESLNNYAHMVSHDLKSPIRNIHALISWIQEDEEDTFSEETKFNYALVNQNLTKVDNLIDGILIHATLEAHEEEKSNVSVKHLIEEIKKTIYIPDNVQVQIKGEVPVLFKDKYKLEQLFKNLIVNAITATENVPKGKVDVDAKEIGNYWQFSVTDNGKGIPKKYQKSIFNMFKKLENNSNATGIGLALVKKIVNIYEGRVWLYSELEKGTTLTFTIKK